MGKAKSFTEPRDYRGVFLYKNKPTSSAPRLKFLYNSTNNPTTKIGMGTHHPTIAFVTFYPVASRNNKINYILYRIVFLFY